MAGYHWSLTTQFPKRRADTFSLVSLLLEPKTILIQEMGIVFHFSKIRIGFQTFTLQYCSFHLPHTSGKVGFFHPKRINIANVWRLEQMDNAVEWEDREILHTFAGIQHPLGFSRPPHSLPLCSV